LKFPLDDLWVVSHGYSMLDLQLRQALFETISVKCVPPSLIKTHGTPLRGNITFLIIDIDSSVEALRQGMAFTHLDT
jgi:hypothetical protein